MAEEWLKNLQWRITNKMAKKVVKRRGIFNFLLDPRLESISTWFTRIKLNDSTAVRNAVWGYLTAIKLQFNEWIIRNEGPTVNIGSGYTKYGVSKMNQTLWLFCGSIARLGLGKDCQTAKQSRV